MNPFLATGPLAWNTAAWGAPTPSSASQSQHAPLLAPLQLSDQRGYREDKKGLSWVGPAAERYSGTAGASAFERLQPPCVQRSPLLRYQEGGRSELWPNPSPLLSDPQSVLQSPEVRRTRLLAALGAAPHPFQVISESSQAYRVASTPILLTPYLHTQLRQHEMFFGSGIEEMVEELFFSGAEDFSGYLDPGEKSPVMTGLFQGQRLHRCLLGVLCRALLDAIDFEIVFESLPEIVLEAVDHQKVLFGRSLVPPGVSWRPWMAPWQDVHLPDEGNAFAQKHFKQIGEGDFGRQVEIRLLMDSLGFVPELANYICHHAGDMVQGRQELSRLVPRPGRLSSSFQAMVAGFVCAKKDTLMFHRAISLKMLEDVLVIQESLTDTAKWTQQHVEDIDRCWQKLLGVGISARTLEHVGFGPQALDALQNMWDVFGYRKDRYRVSMLYPQAYRRASWIAVLERVDLFEKPPV